MIETIKIIDAEKFLMAMTHIQGRAYRIAKLANNPKGSLVKIHTFELPGPAQDFLELRGIKNEEVIFEF